MVVSDLFSQQCKPWKAISENLVEDIHEAAAITFNKLLSEICDVNTRKRLMNRIIQPSLYLLRKNLKDTVAELLQPHLSIHPITYDQHLTVVLQKVQGDRHKRNFDRECLKSGGRDTETVDAGKGEVSLKNILRSVRAATAPNPKEYAASLAADVAEVYYQASGLLKERLVLRLTSL